MINQVPYMSDYSHESERVTRAKRIDPLLVASGWTVSPYDATKPLTAYHRHAVVEYPTANGPADYALVEGGIVIGIVEAKKIVVGPQNVLQQAERYSRGIREVRPQYGEHRVPFLFSTNGKEIWHHDVRHALNRSREIAQFHTPDALREAYGRDFEKECAALLATPNDRPGLRPYQRDANTETEKAIAERKRRIMVAMATGTGKTFTTVNQVYRLMKSGVGKRILFLVDRRALAAQAVRAFASFEAEPGLKFNQIYEIYSQRFQAGDFEDGDGFDSLVVPNVYLTQPHAGLAFTYVCTIQRMAINLFGRSAVMQLGAGESVDEDAGELPIPIHAFDVIIADECHRGYTSSEASLFRKTLDHFDAIKIGLTATPAAHTKAYFTDIVYKYEYERAVREGYLVDYDLVTMESNIKMNGVFLKEGEAVALIDPHTGERQTELLEDESHFAPEDIERKVTSPDSNRKILMELKKYAEAHEEQYGRFPKTLIFAANDIPHTSHADQLVDLAREVFGRGNAFVQKITGSKDVDRPLQRIKEFRNRPEPGIVVTVDMLTTGVDIPDLEYIVFLRLVRSRILFEQMVGRGTRKGDKYPDKSHFTVFDCFGGTLMEYFRNTTGITAEEPSEPTKPLAEIIEEIWNNQRRDYNIKCLVKRLQRVDKEMSGKARDELTQWVPDGDMAGYASGLAAALKAAFTTEMARLRDKGFQHFLVNYERAPRTFVIAYETEDTVTAEWRARGADGKEYKPGDYLTAFSEFVEKNQDQIDAIGILLNRPADWSYDALKDLREKLRAAPEKFTEDQLRRAHQIQYSKPLADIISMVKHAVRRDLPLFTPAERVDRAIDSITAGQEFTTEQTQWLERIRNYMAESNTLAINADDFEASPIFLSAGGWGRANRVFNRGLTDILRHLNEAIAA